MGNFRTVTFELPDAFIGSQETIRAFFREAEVDVDLNLKKRTAEAIASKQRTDALKVLANRFGLPLIAEERI